MAPSSPASEASPSPLVAAARRPGAPAGPGGPLAGTVVLDLASVGPAARCTRVLADYGATVIKVGAVPGRGAEPIRPPFYAYSGSRGFAHLALDLKDPDGRTALLDLVGAADVVVESFRPGVLGRLRLSYDELAAANPRIILCSTTGFGQHGPRAGWAGHDIDYLAVGGYLAATQPRGDGGPPVPGATVADAAAGGLQAALAILAALLGRGADGPGTHLDVSIADGVLWLTSLAVDEHLATGVEVGPGSNIITGRYACYDTYEAADGRWVAVGAIEPKFFANLCRALGCDQWIPHQLDDEVQDKVRADFRAAFATRSRDQWVAQLAGQDTCVAPVLTVAEVAEDEQFRARRAFVEAHAAPGASGPDRFPQVGPVLAGQPGRGEDAEAGDPHRSDADRLLGAVGYDAARIGALQSKGAVA